jgi:hypothetical protein
MFFGLLLGANGAATAGSSVLGRFAAEHRKKLWLYLHSGKLTLAAIYHRRVRVVGHSFAAALKHVLKVVTPPAPAA